MKTENKILINDLLARMNQATQRANALKKISLDKLNHKSSTQSWSALQCIEHLNLYGDFYLPEIEKQLTAKPKVSSTSIFKSGVIGNYFANLMLPKKNGSIKKMKTPADKTPTASDLTLVTLDRFLKQAEKLKQLLQQAEQVDLTKTKTAISLTKMIRLRIGDTLRFVVYHIERHLGQAESGVKFK